MVVGLGHITLRIHACRSLKEKRKVVKSMIGRIRNNFNVSIAEVGSNDVHKKAEIGFAVVGNEKMLVNSKVDKIFNFSEATGLAEITHTEMELISL